MYVYVILILGFIFNIPFLPATSFTRTFLFWLNDDSILLSVNKKICEKFMFLILSAKFMVTYKNIFKSIFATSISLFCILPLPLTQTHSHNISYELVTEFVIFTVIVKYTYFLLLFFLLDFFIY